MREARSLCDELGDFEVGGDADPEQIHLEVVVKKCWSLLRSPYSKGDRDINVDIDTDS